mgnify:CR=1 FL=1
MEERSKIHRLHAGGFQTVDKASQSFSPEGEKAIESVFDRGVYVGENTSQPGSVRVVRRERTASACAGLFPLRRQSPTDFVDGMNNPKLYFGLLSDIWETIHRGSYPELYASPEREWID